LFALRIVFHEAAYRADDYSGEQPRKRGVSEQLVRRVVQIAQLWQRQHARPNERFDYHEDAHDYGDCEGDVAELFF